MSIDQPTGGPSSPAPRVKKVLNSSVVLTVDAQGRESIMLGRGIGYGQKPGNSIQESTVDQVFLPVGDPDVRALMQLLDSVPGAYVLAARDIVTLAQRSLNVQLHPHLLLALTDHLHFAVQRQREGLRVLNRLAWELQAFYPDEYRVGEQAVELIKGAALPEDEAANIAFHLINARNDPQSSFDGLRAATLIGEIINIVSYTVGRSFTRDDLNHRRFVIHLQFFADRLFTGRLLDDDDGLLYQKLAVMYPEAMQCATRARRHVDTKYEVTLPDAEVGYLCLHIQRMTRRASAEATRRS